MTDYASAMSGLPGRRLPRYVTGSADLAELAERCRAAVRIGWDTETTGHNVKKSSPAYRARVDVWSVALPVGPTGRYEGHVLPGEALAASPMRAVLEDPRVEKVAHNARHDLHAAANAGVVVRGVRDTLETARLVWPGLPSYTLKALRVGVLHKPERDSFKDLTEWDEDVVKKRVVCVCCKPGCRKKSWPHAQFEEDVHKKRHHKVDVADIGPDHPRWPLKLDYAAEDAVDAPELLYEAEERMRQLCETLPELPW